MSIGIPEINAFPKGGGEPFCTTGFDLRVVSSSFTGTPEHAHDDNDPNGHVYADQAGHELVVPPSRNQVLHQRERAKDMREARKKQKTYKGR